MKHLSTILTVLAVITSLGCSNHNRTSDSPLTAADVVSMLQDVEAGAQASSSGSGNVSEALALKDRTGAWVFAAFGPTHSMKIANILGFSNFKFVGLNVTLAEITDARVIFINVPDGNNALIVGIKTAATGDQFSYYAFVGNNGEINNGKFSVGMSGTSSAIHVESFDIQDGDLSDVIQLRLFDSNDVYIGKISTLTGFAM